MVGIPSAFAEIRILAEKGKAVAEQELVAHAWPPEPHPSREVIWKNTDEGKFGDRTMLAFRPRNLAEIDEEHA